MVKKKKVKTRPSRFYSVNKYFETNDCSGADRNCFFFFLPNIRVFDIDSCWLKLRDVSRLCKIKTR